MPFSPIQGRGLIPQFPIAALESSLWELSALERHYHPAVSALAGTCGAEDERTPMHDLEEFAAHTSLSLCEQERQRGGLAGTTGGKKRKVALAFAEPKEGLFADDDVFGGFLDRA